MSKKSSPPDLSAAKKLLEDWGFSLDPELLILALTHRSFAHENGGIPTNERLEFLGDAVLQIIVTEYLYRNHPNCEEGDLARMRAATVSQSPLALVARKLNLGAYILLGVGESASGGQNKDSILSDTMEALIGATYLSSGLETTRAIVEKHLRSLLASATQRSKEMDWKSTLQELLLARKLPEAVYHMESGGPDHARVFKATISCGDKVLGTGGGSSKKTAENKAAHRAVETLQANNA